MNLRLRKGTVQVRGKTEDRCHHWHVLGCQRFPAHPLPARPSRPRGLPALRQARRTGHPQPLPGRASFGWFRHGESNPESPEKVWGCSTRAAAGRRGVGSAQPATGVRGRDCPLGGRGGGAPLPATDFPLPRVRRAARSLPGAHPPFLSSLFNSPSEFEWIILWKI